MKDSVNFGPNKTGIQMAPLLSKEMISSPKDFPFPALDETITPIDLRTTYIRESGNIGSVPLPTTVKGAANTVLQKLKGSHPAVLVDKLGERLAFERSGVRLYDALITKCEGALPDLSLRDLRQFREEELEHYFMLKDVIEKIGADPTAMTPCADASSVASLGLIQVLNDPRTTVPQCVEAILIAELTDNEGWDLLLMFATEFGLKEEASRFKAAKMQEEIHLEFMRRWLEQMTFENKAAVAH
jgi:hypothetical protein